MLITLTRQERSALQAKLKNRAGLQANLDRARQELEMAQKLVDSHQRTRGYLTAFEAAFQAAGLAFSDLNSTIPGQLVNSCKDRELRDEWEVAMSLRQAAIAERQQSREKLKRAEQDLASTKTRITALRGEPAILEDGAPLPWDQNFIKKTFTAMQVSFGNVVIPEWAISSDMENIAFAPKVHPDNVKHYSEQWLDDLKAIRMAKVNHVEVERRMVEADEGLAAVKARMIASPI